MSALQTEIDKLKGLQKSYSSLADTILPTAALLTELNNGKQEMVKALATKNVQSSTDKTLSAIADDVRCIAQSPITIEGGEMYEKQLFGAATDKTDSYEQPDTPMWNLYQVMANLLSDGRFVEYGGIVLVEYLKGDDTIALQGAGAGGAYLLSDGSLYYEDINHTWNDMLNDKSNRWVAYALKSEFINFSIDTPSIISVYIGRKVGELKSTSTGLQNVVVFNNSTLKSVNFTNAQNISGNFVLNNVQEHRNGYMLVIPTTTQSAYITNFISDVKEIYSPICDNKNFNKQKTLKAIELNGLESIHVPMGSSKPPLIPVTNLSVFKANKLKSIVLDGELKYSVIIGGTMSDGAIIECKELEQLESNYISHGDSGLFSIDTRGYYFFNSLKKCRDLFTDGTSASGRDQLALYILFGCKGEKEDTINPFTPNSKLPYCLDIEIGDKENIDKGLEPRWYPCQNVDFSMAIALTEENIINHILKRLKQDEEMCGSGVTITLGSTNLARLTSEEAVALLDSLTNTYGYTFA